jgi:hypothetical protein
VVRTALIFGRATVPGFTQAIGTTFTPGTATGGSGVIIGDVAYGAGVRFRPGRSVAGLGRAFIIKPVFRTGLTFASADPSFNQVKLLLHGWDGIQDSSFDNVAITAGSAVTTTSNALFGGEAILMSRVENSWIEISQINLSGDFTVEAWIYLDSLPTGTFETYVIDGPEGNIRVNRFGVVTVFYRRGGGTTIISGGGITIKKWHLIRFTASGTTPRLFIDGDLKTTGQSGIALSMVLSRIGFLSRPGNLNYRIDGAVQGVRFSQVARSVASFTLPTQSWPDSTNRLQAGLLGTSQSVNTVLTPGTATGV